MQSKLLLLQLLLLQPQFMTTNQVNVKFDQFVITDALTELVQCEASRAVPAGVLGFLLDEKVQKE